MILFSDISRLEIKTSRNLKCHMIKMLRKLNFFHVLDKEREHLLMLKVRNPW